MKPRDKELKAILRERPDDVDARVELSDFHIDHGRPSEAERVLDEGFKRSPGAWKLFEAKADLLMIQRRFGEVAAVIDAGVAAGMPELESTVLRGSHAFHEERWSDAIEPLGRAAELASDVPEFGGMLARALFEESKLDEAKAEAERVLGLDRHNADAHQLLSEALLFEQRFQRAAFHADRVLEGDPLRDAAILVRATCERNLKGVEEATTWLRDHLDAHGPTMGGLFLLAELYEAAKYLGSAIDVSRELVKLRPTDARTRLELAARLMRAGHRDEAADHARRALAADGRSIEARMLLASLALRGERLAEAELHVTAAERDAGERDQAKVATMRAQLEAGRGRAEAAEAAYRRAVELDPELGTAWAGLAAVLQRRERLDEALEAIRTAVRVDPDVAIFRAQLIDLLEQAGLAEEAANERKVFERAVGPA